MQAVNLVDGDFCRRCTCHYRMKLVFQGRLQILLGRLEIRRFSLRRLSEILRSEETCRILQTRLSEVHTDRHPVTVVDP
jgi:hypothetical protein